MRNIIDYTLLVDFDDNDPDNFNMKIGDLTKDGWQPFGNHSTAIGINKDNGEEYYIFSQAMVKYEQSS